MSKKRTALNYEILELSRHGSASCEEDEEIETKTDQVLQSSGPLESESYDDAEKTTSSSATVNECSRLQLEQAVTENQEKEKSVNKVLRQAQILLYVSHFFSQFAEGAWQFAVILFLAAITQYRSILLVSTYYLSTYAAGFVFGAPLGRFVDQANRLVAAKVCIFVQNGSVLVATICCCWLLTKNENNNGDDNNDGIPKDALSIILMVGVHVFGSVAQVLDQAFVVAIERDWIVILSQQAQSSNSDDDNNSDTAEAETWLSNTNVALRQIDLTCKVLAPAVAGFVVGQVATTSNNDETTANATHITNATHVTTASHGHGGFCDLHGAAILVGTLNVTALFVEYVCTANIYHLIPALSLPGGKRRTSHSNGSYFDVTTSNVENDREKEEFIDEYEEVTPPNVGTNGTTVGSSLWHGLVVYIEQPVVWGGVSLSALYINVLSFGGYMTAFLLWKGMSVEEVGLWRSIASITGLLGTFAYQISTKWTSVINTGFFSVLYLFGCLTLAMASFILKDYTSFSMYLLVVSSALSRTGLWVFDITITLLFQEFVPDGVRGLVGGTQQAMNSFLVVLIGCLGLFLSRPEEFYVFAIVSYLGICTCTVAYTLGIFCRRHLFRRDASESGKIGITVC